MQVMAVDACKVSNPEAHAKFLRLAHQAWNKVRGSFDLHVSDWQELRPNPEIQETLLKSSCQPELTDSQARVLAWAINELLDKCST